MKKKIRLFQCIGKEIVYCIRLKDELCECNECGFKKVMKIEDL